MLRCRMLSPFLRSIKELSCGGYVLNVRQSATVPTGFDEEALAAAKPFEELPSVLSVPFLGTAWVFLPVIGRYDIRKVNESFLEKRKILGNIYREKFGSIKAVISFNADDLQTMFKHEGAYPVRSQLESMKTYRESRKEWFKTRGLAVANGQEWWDLRKKVQKHLMKPKAIQSFLDPMQDVARDFVKKIVLVRDSNKEVPNFLVELYKWALESVALVGLDARLGSLEPNLPPNSEGMRMIDSVQTILGSIPKLEKFSGRLQLWKIFPTPTWTKFVKAGDTFIEIAFKHINRSIERLRSTTDANGDLTLLQSFLLEEDMEPSDAMVMVSDMLFAGIDTTSHTVAFFLYDMAKNPEKQEKLYQELQRILPRKEDRISTSVFNELKYLKSCIKESQRCHAIVGAHARILDHDVIPSGYRIPAKTLLFMSIQAIHRDERYFSKPNEYLPERWLNKDEKFHPFAFLPFGFGVRSCVGRRLAELEIISLTSEIIRNFKIEYHHEDIGMFSRLINVPDKPMRICFIDR